MNDKLEIGLKFWQLVGSRTRGWASQEKGKLELASARAEYSLP